VGHHRPRTNGGAQSSDAFVSIRESGVIRRVCVCGVKIGRDRSIGGSTDSNGSTKWVKETRTHTRGKKGEDTLNSDLIAFLNK
jgi:hypothetical protein